MTTYELFSKTYAPLTLTGQFKAKRIKDGKVTYQTLVLENEPPVEIENGIATVLKYNSKKEAVLFEIKIEETQKQLLD